MNAPRDAFRFTFSDIPDKLSVVQVAWDQAAHIYEDDPGISKVNLNLVYCIWKNLARDLGGDLISDYAANHYIHHEKGSATHLEQIEGGQRLKALSLLALAHQHYKSVVSEILDGKLKTLQSGLIDPATYDTWLDSVKDKLPTWSAHDLRFNNKGDEVAEVSEEYKAPAGYQSPELLLAIEASKVFWSDYSPGKRGARETSDNIQKWLKGDPIKGYPVKPKRFGKCSNEEAKRIDRLIRPPELKSGGNLKLPAPP